MGTPAPRAGVLWRPALSCRQQRLGAVLVLCAGNLLSSGLRVEFKKKNKTRESHLKWRCHLPALVTHGIYVEFEFIFFY